MALGEAKPTASTGGDFWALLQAAAEGLVEARVAAEAKAAAKAAERASAQRGERPPLPAHPLAEADAADFLIAADEMLRVRIVLLGLRVGVRVWAWLPPGGVQGWRACPHAQPGRPSRGAPPAAARQLHLLAYYMRCAQVHPELEAARCMRVEGLIHCRRYEDAAAACEVLLTDSVDAMYLQAELRWRQNELAGAMEAAETAVRAPPPT